jgi:signal transduction histidine kinase
LELGRKVKLATADNATVIPNPMRVFLAVGALLTLGYFILPSAAKPPCYAALGVAGAIALIAGVRLYRPSRPLAWYLLAAGQLLFTAGDAVNNIYAWILHLEPPFPSVADALYLSVYVLQVAGLLLLVRGQTPGRDRTSLIDAVIIATGIGLLSWIFLIVPYVRAPDLTLMQRLVSIAYPVADVLLLAVAIRLWRPGSVKNVASLMLTLCLSALLISDTAYGLSQLTIGWVPGGALDLIWIAYAVGLGATALHPSMRTLSEPAPAPTPRLTWQRRILLTGATLMAPAMLVIQAVRHQPIDVGVNAAGTVVLFVLLTARMTGLAGQAARQEERERALAKVLEAAQQERIRLAADLHDGPVQELTALNYGLERVDRRLQTDGPDAVRELLGEQKDHLTMVTRTLRSLLSELRPPALDEHGLAGALKLYGDAFAKQAGVNVSVDAQVDERPAPEVETIVYRITQEALTNVAKHAQARHVWIRLVAGGQAVDLTIRDDGVGFDPEQAARLLKDGHFGLVGMRERAEMGGGRMDLDSRPDHGTTIHLTLPLRYVPSFA